MSAMAHGSKADPWERGDLVRNASAHHGAWPRVFVMHGEADDVVSPVNAEHIASQWRDVHALPDVPEADETTGFLHRRIWGNGEVEMLTIENLAHGAPVDSDDDTAPEGGFFPNIGFDSTRHIAEFFGLAAVSGKPSRQIRPFDILPIHYVPSFMRHP